MAVRIYEKWHGVIASVETINKKLPGGMRQLMDFSLSLRGRNTSSSKVMKLLGISQKISFEDFDNYIIGTNKSFHGMEGCDGNLYYMAHKDGDAVQQMIDYLEEEGLGYDDIYYADPNLFLSEENEKHPLPWLTKDYAMLPRYADCIKASCVQYSIYPYEEPYKPSKFPTHQGGILFNTEHFWVQYQEQIKINEAKKQFDLLKIQERYINAFLWNKNLPSLDNLINNYIFGTPDISMKYKYLIDGTQDKHDMIMVLLNFEDSDLPF